MSIYDKTLETTKVVCDNPYLWRDLANLKERRIYLYGEMMDFDNEDHILMDKMTVAEIVRAILEFNKEDAGKKTEERQPIILYINSPGGNIGEGMPLISAIELSKTPVYTVNIGEWCSMAFLIGITGHKRFSLPYMTFLMHDGSNYLYGTQNKVQDAAEFYNRFKDEVMKQHILKHGSMSEEEYDKLARVEYYMLPEDAMKHNFIDKIVTSLDEIL